METEDTLSRSVGWTATLGPIGYWPVGPGTVAAALVTVGWWAWGPPLGAWIGVVLALCGASIASAGRAEKILGPDDGRIVIDEAAGMAVALVGAPPTVWGAAVGFVLFRAFDIGKPPPVGRMQDLHGGAGILLDDVAAGALAAISSWLGFLLFAFAARGA